ncbi:hypothetical protein [Formosa sp. A9]|uniref:hypothetical protein n=1 Tax=Formosa sp. A9 TaxID=3442641 RepID=UPI003EBB500B
MSNLKENEYEFIKSSKVIRHILNPAAADILATLIYKYKYWAKENKLQKHDGELWFYISLSDLEIETSYKESVLKGRLKDLKERGLIKTKRQGLNKPNLYSLKEKNIIAYIKKNEQTYKDWAEAKRKGKSTNSKTLAKSRIDENQLSGEVDLYGQDKLKVTTTNNKSTKNKVFTNPKIGVIDELELDENWESEFEALIEEFQGVYDNELKAEYVDRIFSKTQELNPNFQKFKMSDKDKELILSLNDNYALYSDVKASKIMDNAKAILRGDKKCRYGNLFVGLTEIMANNRAKYNK